MGRSSMKFTMSVDNTEQFKKLLDGKKKEILEEAGRFVSGEAKLRAPVDTGKLRDSLTEQMNGQDQVDIGTVVEYSDYVELGTSRQDAQPYLLPAFEENIEAIKSIMRTRISELGG